jgi:hypothetical protein
MAFDSGRGVIVLFGGGATAYGFLNDTWEWNGTDWTQQSPTTTPPIREDHRIAYDASLGVTLLFAGFDADLPPDLDDTWQWDGMNWTQLAPVRSPAARDLFGLVYDPNRDNVVLFGGHSDDSGTVLGDTWEWN